MAERQWCSRRDKRTARRAGHVWLSKTLYKGEAYAVRCSFGAFRPGFTLYDELAPFEFVAVRRGRKAVPKGVREIERKRAEEARA